MAGNISMSFYRSPHRLVLLTGPIPNTHSLRIKKKTAGLKSSFQQLDLQRRGRQVE